MEGALPVSLRGSGVDLGTRGMPDPVSPQLGLDDSALLQELHAAQQRLGFGDPSL